MWLFQKNSTGTPGPGITKNESGIFAFGKKKITSDFKIKKSTAHLIAAGPYNFNKL